MSGSDTPQLPGPLDYPDDFFPDDLTTGNTAVTKPEGVGIPVEDDRTPVYVERSTVAPEPAPPTPAYEPPPPIKPERPPEPSGLVVEIGVGPESASPSEPESENDPDEDTSTKVMTWMAIAVGASTAGLIGAAVLFFVFSGTATEDDPTEERTTVEDVRGVKVRRGLRGTPTEEEPEEPKAP